MILGVQGNFWGHKTESSNSQEKIQLMFSLQNIYFKPWGIKYFQTAYVKLNFLVKDQNLQIWRVKGKKKKMQEILSIANILTSCKSQQ